MSEVDPPRAVARTARPGPDRPDLLRTVLDQHGASLHRYARRVCLSGADADDAAQATLEKLVAAPTRIRDATRTRQWLFTVVRHHCLRLIARAWRWRSFAEPTQADAFPQTHALGPDDAILVGRVLQAIAELDPSQREVLIRRDVLQESGEEVARALGLSLAATKSRLHRARKALSRLGAGR